MKKEKSILPSKEEVLKGIRNDLKTDIEELEERINVLNEHLKVVENELGIKENKLINKNNPLILKNVTLTPNIPFIPTKFKRGLFCNKCGNYSTELNDDGFCQKCYYQETK